MSLRSSVYGSKWEIVARTKRHKGSPKPPRGVWVSPATEREREREREKKKGKRRRRTYQQREKRGTQTIVQTRVGS